MLYAAGVSQQNDVEMRPQDKFKTPIDNSLNHFEPRIKYKPNALVPFDLSPICTKRGKYIVSYRHPYVYEIDSFELLKSQRQILKPIESRPIHETPLIFVDCISELDSMVNILKHEQEIAIDLECHSRRSFLGLTCIMQISTRNTDYIIDTLELRDDLYVLNEIFTEPRTLKVLHGSSSDINCLQRDLSLYIVNLFDTMEATKCLNMPSNSLCALMKQYCGVESDKTIRTKCDWRLRPLTPQQLKYAREDTHYLLFIYDNLRNDLLLADKQYDTLLNTVYNRSRELCKIVYVKPKLTNPMKLYRRTKKPFNANQMEILGLLVDWRDMMAREKDESLNYVLPDEMLIRIAEKLPRSCDELLDCCSQSCTDTPRYVQLYKEDLLKLIQII